MEKSIESYVSNSGELKVTLFPDLIICKLGDISKGGTQEYLEVMRQVGVFMSRINSGKVLADIRQMKNYDIASRAAATSNLSELVLKKAPFFLLSVVKGKSLFENLAMQTAISVSKPLSKKFLDGKLFDSQDEAITWLRNYRIPQEFLKN